MQSSDLSRIPARQRQRMALLLVPPAAALLLAGLLLAWRAGSLAGHLIGALVLLGALALLGIGHGLFWSARADLSEQRLDDAIRTVAGDDCGGDCGSCASDCAVRSLPRSQPAG